MARLGRPPVNGTAFTPAERSARYRARCRGALEPPIVVFRAIALAEANAALKVWGHRLGPVSRPCFALAWAHGLFVGDRLVAVATTHQSIAGSVAGLPRAEVAELSRLCASGPQWCRVALRLWREVVLPGSGRFWGVSYQDSVLHRGEIYRTDGWTKIGASRSGTDRRSGREGRSKIIWGYRLPGR
jgi:antitoxin VapB